MKRSGSVLSSLSLVIRGGTCVAVTMGNGCMVQRASITPLRTSCWLQRGRAAGVATLYTKAAGGHGVTKVCISVAG